MSSTFSLGEPIAMTPTGPMESLETSVAGLDLEAEEEFSKVVNGIKETSINEDEPVSRRPTRPHHSVGERRSPHPLSPIESKESGTAISEVAKTSTAAPLKQCLFCNYDSPSFKLNVHHMNKFHGMFIPEQTYLVDLEGLIGYLYKKISENHECLSCHKLKGSTASIQTHMRDKGHCMIAFESEEEMIEVGQFYDFTSTYSDHEDDEEMVDDEDDAKGGVKLGRPKEAKIIISDENGDQEMDDPEAAGEGWETDSEDAKSETEMPNKEPEPEPSERRPSAAPRRPSLLSTRRHSLLEDLRPNPRSPSRAAFTSDYELHLPSGRTAGHRSLARYFRQNLHSYPSPSEQMQRRAIEEGGSSGSDEEMTVDRPANERGRQITTRANGGLGMVGVTDAKKKEVKATEKRDEKRAQREMREWQWGVNKRGNQQKHFRDPLLQ